MATTKAFELGDLGTELVVNADGTVSSLDVNTDSIAEGSTNQYHTTARARASISVSGNLTYDSGTGVLGFTMPTTIASLSNHDTDDLSEGSGNLYFTSARARASLTGGTGITYSSSTGGIEITDSGVTAGSYGSASQVPVITVNAQGQITSASTTAVAGVSSTAYDTSTGVLTINTSDGGSFTEDLGVGTADSPTFTQLTLSGSDALTISNQTARIRAATDLELIIDYDNNNLGSLAVKNGGGTAVATIDESGNASFTGTVTVDTGLHVKDGDIKLLDSTSNDDILIGWAGGTYSDPGFAEVDGISLRYGAGVGIVVSKDDSDAPYNFYSYRYGASWSNGHHMQFVNNGASVGTIESDSNGALVVSSTSAITLKTSSNSNSVIVDGALNSLWPVRNDVMDLGRTSNRWQDLYLSSVIDSNRQGNSGYGNAMFGSTTDNTTKWASLRVRHYNNSVETEGFAFISAASSASQNAVFVGGGLDEENVATDIFMNIGSTQAVRGNVDVEVFRANIAEAVFNENSYDRDFRVESNNKTHMLFVDGTYDRVGINESTPASKLEVVENNGSQATEADKRIAGFYKTASNANDEGYIHLGNGDGHYGVKLGFHMEAGTPSYQNHGFYISTVYNNENITNHTKKFVVKANGKVGIGTESPSTKLHVYGTDPSTTIQSTSAAPILKIQAPSNQLTRIEMSDGSNPVILDSRPDMGDGLMIYENGANNTIFRGGNVGIGTTSPTKRLDIRGGDVTIYGGVDGYNADQERVRLYMGNNNAHVGAMFNYGLFFDPGNGAGDAMMIRQSTGYVGINDNTPSYHLDVNGAIRSQATGGTGGLRLHTNSGITASANYMNFFTGQTAGWRFNANGTGADTDEKLRIDLSGNATFAGDVTANSDVRLKSDIQTITNAVDTVKALRGTAYIKDGKASIGVIAQEIEEVLPQVVSTADDEMGTKSVAYGNIVAVLIEAIKEQQEQIDELKKLLEAK